MNRGSGSGDSGHRDVYGRRGGVNLPALRGHNDALVLDLLRAAGPAGLGRTELAARTGLTPQAVSKITARLGAEGLVAEAGRAASTGGKPRTLLRLVPDVRHAVGVHLDRDELLAVRVDLAGRVVAESGGPLDFGAGPEAAVEAVVRAVARVGDPSGPPLLGVGVAAPGPLDHRAGVMGRVTGFPSWKDFPLRGVLEGRLGLPVVLDKDTNAGAAAAAGAWLRATWPDADADADADAGADAYVGRGMDAGPDAEVAEVYAGGGARTCVYLHIGTGLGAGLWLGGGVYRGARSAAGEFGHQVLLLDGPRCRCGARGCVEALCLEAVARGDVPEAARIVGEAAANLVALLDVDRVLLGGRVVAAAPDVFVARVGAVLAARALDPARPVVALAGAGVAQGAAEMALTPLFGRG
ncbi:ROK family transcriptional regulator [Streptomyces erythrochromogenes]|uniref:ROK family transcriptional regulator n=1 Tax=Streptomyces erythrochromogenes TaxID=285574 RepID=UPI002252D8BB|nr:ROK family transcriptional regulator [Streptomyces erythrochromogenes]MCX5586606.1 ROK family transcriptional regulator [Streptomyces erythrochromogenes]